ncbi:MAG TPA: hypothetical protein V6D33_11345 [Cyanophyceae cyanobacterium]
MTSNSAIAPTPQVSIISSERLKQPLLLRLQENLLLVLYQIDSQKG